MATKKALISTALVLAPSPTTLATAANKYWKNSVGGGNWSGGNNWGNVSAAGADNGGAPAAGDTVHIIPTEGAARTITYDVTAPPLFITYVDLTGPGTNRTTLSMSGNTLTTQALGVGYTGRATFNHSGGTVNVNGTVNDMAVGEHAGGDGIYNLSGTGAVSVAHDLFVGRYAGSTGTFNQTGGTNSITNRLDLGWEAGATGAYNLTSGALVTNTLVSGVRGTGTFIQTGGSHTNTGGVTIGAFAGSSGTYNISGGALTTIGILRNLD